MERGKRREEREERRDAIAERGERRRDERKEAREGAREGARGDPPARQSSATMWAPAARASATACLYTPGKDLLRYASRIIDSIAAGSNHPSGSAAAAAGEPPPPPWRGGSSLSSNHSTYTQSRTRSTACVTLYDAAQ